MGNQQGRNRAVFFAAVPCFVGVSGDAYPIGTIVTVLSQFEDLDSSYLGESDSLTVCPLGFNLNSSHP
jgi:hypothetical protein